LIDNSPEFLFKDLFVSKEILHQTNYVCVLQQI